jgi:hypothetical protein
LWNVRRKKMKQRLVRAIPFNDHTLDLTLGGIASKPSVVDGQIAIREYLCMTLSFDHTIIDGAPAAASPNG